MSTRYTRRNPCPICGGHRDLPQHRGIRCYGYADDTGDYARCTRDELGGEIKQNDDGTYSHLLRGACRCGQQHGAAASKAAGSAVRDNAELVGTSSWRAYRPDGSFAIHRRWDYSDGRKSLAWFHPDGQASQNGEIRSTDKLYGLACLDRVRPALLVEGEKAADSLRAMVGDGYAVLATACGAPTVPDAEVLAYVAGKVGPDGLTIWADNDVQGAKQMEGCAVAVLAHNVAVRRVTWPDAPAHGDAADYCATHGKDELLALLEAAKPWNAGPVPPVVPGETAELLGQIESFVRRYVVLPHKDDYLIVALWILHAWAIDAFDVTPRLIASSPEPESGKTRLLEVIKVLIPQAVFSLNITAAAIYSFVGKGKRPLLFDEVDAVFSQKANDEGSEALRGILNGGYSRAATVIRVKMPGRIVEEFPVFAPAALATIGRLPNTIESRAITMRMQRRTDAEHVESFRERDARKAAVPILELVQQWAPASTATLREARPEMPESINDRAADILESLFAIADLAGEECAERARTAAVELMRDRLADEQSIGIQLLRAIHDGWVSIADPAKPDQVTTADLLAYLNHLDEYQFGSWNKGNGFHSRNLAAYLKQYALRSRGVRVADSTPKGYIRHDFKDAWSRYLKPIRHAATLPQHIRNANSYSDTGDVADVCVYGEEETEGIEDPARDVDISPSLSSLESATKSATAVRKLCPVGLVCSLMAPTGSAFCCGHPVEVDA